VKTALDFFDCAKLVAHCDHTIAADLRTQAPFAYKLREDTHRETALQTGAGLTKLNTIKANIVDGKGFAHQVI
jgi:predicted small metal-binding protein